MVSGASENVVTYVWEPGRDPVPGTAVPEDAPEGTLLWVDAENALPDELIAATERLELPELHEAMLWHLFSNVSPHREDPGASTMPEFDPAFAAQLRGAGEVKLLQAFEPVFVVFSEEVPRRWSYVSRRVGLLVGPSWLVTYRAAPLDFRFAGYEAVGPTAHKQLREACRDFAFTTQTPADVATLMRAALARRAQEVGDDLADEVANRLFDIHRVLARENGSEPTPSEFARTRFELFDLRWVLDLLERAVRQMLPERSAEVEAFDRGLRDRDVAKRVALTYERTLEQCAQTRRSMQEALAWLTGEQSSELLHAQMRADARAGQLQRLVGLLTVYVLGPTLVASLFGAQPAWFDDHQELRTAAMLAGIVLTTLAGAWLVRRFPREEPAPEDAPKEE
jgi:hypothetical protein